MNVMTTNRRIWRSFYLVLLIIAPVFCQKIYWNQRDRVFVDEFGVTRQCNQNADCPLEHLCLPNPLIPGTKGCIADVHSTTQHRGRCPPEARKAGSFCLFDADCFPDQKCCNIPGAGRSCTKLVEISPETRLTTLLIGNSSKSNHLGSVTLIQSKERNILWDLGSPFQKVDLIRGLSDKAGLQLMDIDLVLLSHGHPTYSGSTCMFPDTPINLYEYQLSGLAFYPNEFVKQKSSRFFVLNDVNLELLKTPGHTMEDTTLIVRIAVLDEEDGKQHRVVALTGDLINNEFDENAWLSHSQFPELQRENRKSIFCLADFIIPGHGPSFAVTDYHREHVGGC